jgi:hypothetical protein
MNANVHTYICAYIHTVVCVPPLCVSVQYVFNPLVLLHVSGSHTLVNFNVVIPCIEHSRTLNEALIRNSRFTLQLVKNVLIGISGRFSHFGTRITLITISVTIQYVSKRNVHILKWRRTTRRSWNQLRPQQACLQLSRHQVRGSNPLISPPSVSCGEQPATPSSRELRSDNRRYFQRLYFVRITGYTFE